MLRSRKVSGRRQERMSPDPEGTVTVRGNGIDRGQTQWPTSLLDVVPWDVDGMRGVSMDFAHMGSGPQVCIGCPRPPNIGSPPYRL